MGKLALVLIIGHLIADYPLQSETIIQAKKKSYKGGLLHILIHLITYTILIALGLSFGLIEWTNSIIFLVGTILIIHFCVDLLKEWLNPTIDVKIKNSYHHSLLKAVTYIFDQFLHIITIVLATELTFKDELKITAKFINVFILKDKGAIDFTSQILLTIIIVLINSYFFGYLIGILLRPFKPLNFIVENIVETNFSPNQALIKNPNRMHEYLEVNQKSKKTYIIDSPPKAGMWIGVLERNLILILAMISNWSSIGFLIAMKSLSRFKQFEDKTFAEYYLIGTMLSILCGIISGIFLKGIWLSY